MMQRVSEIIAFIICLSGLIIGALSVADFFEIEEPYKIYVNGAALILFPGSLIWFAIRKRETFLTFVSAGGLTISAIRTPMFGLSGYFFLSPLPCI